MPGLAARASLWNRRRKFELFMRTVQPGPETRVVDVGVGDTGFGTEPGIAVTHNFFEALYPWPERITAVSDVPLPNLRCSERTFAFVPSLPSPAAAPSLAVASSSPETVVE